MGWGNCGTDSNGRAIGYIFHGRCDHPWCFREIDRGLAYACGGMHGRKSHMTDLDVCDGYYCDKHQIIISVDGECDSVCHNDYAELEDLGYCLECSEFHDEECAMGHEKTGWGRRPSWVRKYIDPLQNPIRAALWLYDRVRLPQVR